METLCVRPAAGGWIVESDAHLEPIMFHSGAEAERTAKGLAGELANKHGQAQVVVHDRTGLVAGSIVIGTGGKLSAKAATR